MVYQLFTNWAGSGPLPQAQSYVVLEESSPDKPGHTAKCGAAEKQNTEACEQLNSWITGRTKSSLEMPPGRFAIYWRTLFQQHNVWLEAEADCLRRRFAKGKMQHDPDKTRSG